MINKKRILLVLLTLVLVTLLFGFPWSASGATPAKPLKILVSIKPVYSLVCGLTKDVPNVKTELLLSPPNSPHTFQLKPSDVNKIVKSDLVIWLGPELENFLINPLNNLKPPSQTLALIHSAHLKLLNTRENAQWEAHDHGAHDHADHNHNHDHHGIDPHVWLNTDNAKQMVMILSQKLQEIDPKHKPTYIKNQNTLIKKLNLLKKQMTENLKPVKNKPFLVFHDAYQYFEQEFGLNAMGSITVNPQVPLSAKRLQDIQTIIKKNNIQCVFSEPEFSQTIVQKLLHNTTTRSQELDPLGARVLVQKHQEDEVYFDLMMGLSHSFRGCLLN